MEFRRQNLNPVKIGAVAVVENSCICAVVYVKCALVCVNACQLFLARMRWTEIEYDDANFGVR